LFISDEHKGASVHGLMRMQRHKIIKQQREGKGQKERMELAADLDFLG